MNIEFDGFSPVLPPWLLILTALACLISAFWSYRHLQVLPPRLKRLLIALRSLLLLFLVLLLANPVFLVGSMTVPELRIHLYMDNSRSMGVTAGDYQGEETYRSVLGELFENKPDDIEITTFSFGGEVRQDSPDSIRLDRPVTDLDGVIGHIASQTHLMDAAVLISDGVITRGRDPAFQASGLMRPLYTIALGEPSPMRDIAIHDLTAPITASVNSELEISGTIRHREFEGEPVTMRLMRNGTEVESRQIVLDSEVSTHTFRVRVEERGLNRIELQLEPVAGEWRTDNNRRAVTVRAEDNRIRVWHAAFAVHPDAGYLRQMLDRDPRIELVSRTWMGNRFLEGDWPQTEDSADLLIVHGVPPSGQASLLLAARDRPLLILFAGLESEFSDLVDLLPPPLPSAGPIRHLHGVPARNNAEPHPIIDGVMQSGRPFPLLNYPSLPDRVSPAYHTVLTATSGDETDPILFLDERGAHRRALLTASGWYRYRLSSRSEVREFSEELLTRLVYWTATTEHATRPILAADRDVFEEGETVRFQAYVREPAISAQPADARLVALVTDGDGRQHRLELRNVGEGLYRGSLPGLPPGRYSYRLEPTQEEQTDEFLVESLSAELFDTQRDDDRMRELARLTGGEMFTQDDFAQVWPAILNQQPAVQGGRNSQSLRRSLHEFPRWFVLVLLLLTAEWLVRKRYSLP